MSHFQIGKRLALRLRARKGTAAVPVETDCATEQDEAVIGEEPTDLTAIAASGPQASGDTGDTSESTSVPGVEGATVEPEDADAEAGNANDVEPAKRKRSVKWGQVLAFAVLPMLAVLIGAAAGFLKWQDAWIRNSEVAGIESVAAAKESTVALLSYQPDSVDKDLGAARDRLTGKFKDSYAQLVQDVVIPGAKKDHIAAIATVPAAALVSATPDHAVALVYVNQTVTVGNDAPADTSSTVRVSMDKVGNRWLVSAFDPV